MKLIRFARNVLLLALVAAFVALGVVALRAPHEIVSPALPVVRPGLAASAPTPSPPASSLPATDCAAPSSFADAAGANAQSLNTLAVSPFGVSETGWAAYAPLVAREVGTACGPETPGFAAALAAWQARHSLRGAGRLDGATLSALSLIWLERRPFVMASKKICPAAPNEASLAQASPDEAYGGKTIKARPAALEAYRRLADAARQDLHIDPPFRIASAYRGPVEEAIRCALGGCGTAGKARCSAHRTGLAFDFYLGAAPGSNAFSTDAANRFYLSRTPAYRWLVANADRFGFVNYPYEPWHWEWTGEPV